MKKHLRRLLMVLLIVPLVIMLIIPIIFSVVYCSTMPDLGPGENIYSYHRIGFAIIALLTMPCWLTIEAYFYGIMDATRLIFDNGFSMMWQNPLFNDEVIPFLILSAPVYILPLISMLFLKKTSIFYRIFFILPLLLMILIDIIAEIDNIIIIKDGIYLLIAVIVDILYTIERRKNRL